MNGNVRGKLKVRYRITNHKEDKLWINWINWINEILFLKEGDFKFETRVIKGITKDPRDTIWSKGGDVLIKIGCRL